MREIKFRAWDEDIKVFVPLQEWIEELKNSKVRLLDKEIITNFINLPNLLIALNNTKIMQYTGLKDKNGKEIYEGDIVSLFYETQISEVRFNSKYGCWEVKVQLSIHSQGWDLLGNHLGESEVIGNIYENPELLEVEEC